MKPKTSLRQTVIERRTIRNLMVPIALETIRGLPGGRDMGSFSLQKGTLALHSVYE